MEQCWHRVERARILMPTRGANDLGPVSHAEHWNHCRKEQKPANTTTPKLIQSGDELCVTSMKSSRDATTRVTFKRPKSHRYPVSRGNETRGRPIAGSGIEVDPDGKGFVTCKSFLGAMTRLVVPVGEISARVDLRSDLASDIDMRTHVRLSIVARDVLVTARIEVVTAGVEALQ